MNNNNNRFLSLTVIFFLPLRLPRQSYNYYVLLLLLSSHTHYSLSLSAVWPPDKQALHTHTNWEIPKVQGPGRLIMVGPFSTTHTHEFSKKTTTMGEGILKAKSSLLTILSRSVNLFFSTSLNLSKKGTSFSFFLSKWKGAPLLFVLVRVWWPGHVPL